MISISYNCLGPKEKAEQWTETLRLTRSVRGKDLVVVLLRGYYSTRKDTFKCMELRLLLGSVRDIAP